MSTSERKREDKQDFIRRTVITIRSAGENILAGFVGAIRSVFILRSVAVKRK